MARPLSGFLDAEGIEGLLEGFESWFFGAVFVAYPAGVTEFFDCAGNGWVVDFLGFVEVVTTGVARCVEMADMLDVGADGANEVAFHDLHVVDVVEQLNSWGIDGADDLNAPSRVVALIIGVIDFRVEQFQNEGYTCCFGHAFDEVESFDGVLGAFLFGFAVTVARKDDQVRNGVFFRHFEGFTDFILDAGVVFALVEAIGERLVSANRNDGETHVAELVELFFGRHFDASDSEVVNVFERFDGHRAKSPAGDGLFERTHDARS